MADEMTYSHMATHPTWVDENCWQVWAWVEEFKAVLIVFTGTILECAAYRVENFA